MKSFFKNAALVAASSLFMLLALEVFLRFLPVNDGFNFQPVNEAQPIYRAEPNKTITTSFDWDFKNARELKINNAGFRNDQDYIFQTDQPLIAIIGDSYVEAIQVDYKDTFYGRLSRDLENVSLVYSLGYSGAPLSQYLIWAKYAKETYGADYLVFNIVSNDFDESFEKYRTFEGFHQYNECSEGNICNKRNDYEIGPFRPIITSSALLRYLFFNVQVTLLQHRFSKNDGDQRYVANVLEKVNDEVIENSKLATDLFFDDLSELGFGQDKIVFLVDGRVYDMDETKFDSSFFGQMREYFLETGKNKGYTTIDLRKHYANHFILNGQYFESAYDAHWNELGHEIAAEKLFEYFKEQLQ